MFQVLYAQILDNEMWEKFIFKEEIEQTTGSSINNGAVALFVTKPSENRE